MSDFWIPKYRHELIHWLHRNYGYKVWKLKEKNLTELYAIFFKHRKKAQLIHSESSQNVPSSKHETEEIQNV